MGGKKIECVKFIWRYKFEYEPDMTRLHRLYKSDVFTFGLVAALTNIIYLVCTADSLKLCIYSKAPRWKR